MIDLLETLSLSYTVRLCKGVGLARSLSLRLRLSQQTFLCPLLMSAVDAQRFRYSVVSFSFFLIGKVRCRDTKFTRNPRNSSFCYGVSWEYSMLTISPRALNIWHTRGVIFNISSTLRLCSKLRQDHTGPMGPMVRSRVPIKNLYPNPIPGLTAPGDLKLKERGHKDITADQRALGWGCNCGSSPDYMQLHIPDIPGGKESRGQRSIINLKGLYRFVKSEHFKMEEFHVLPDLIQQGDWMIKLDLKDA